MKVKVINKSPFDLPGYKTPHAAGMDLRADLSSELLDDLEIGISLVPGERRIVPTGLFIELPESFEAQIRPRSGLAAKKGISVLNTPGTIDADYRGEIKVILYNSSDLVYTINHGDRIAQMVVAPVMQVEWEPTEELETTDRGEGGFGHTGK